MSLKDTSKQLKTILDSVNSDLEKADKGNKAAAQRVRTGTIKLEKVAKVYRKESVKAEKSGSFKKPKGKSSSKASSASNAKGKKESASSKSSGKSSAKGSSAKGKQSTAKKPTAKIIKKKK